MAILRLLSHFSQKGVQESVQGGLKEAVLK